MKVVHNRFLDTDDADKWVQRAKGEGRRSKVSSSKFKVQSHQPSPTAIAIAISHS